MPARDCGKQPAVLRVLFITRKWPPAVGGMETYSVELANVLSTVCRLSVRRLPGRTDGRPPRTAALGCFMLGSMLAIALGKRVDVIHIGDLVLWPLAVVARLFQPSAGIVIAAHGTDIGFTRRTGFLPRVLPAVPGTWRPDSPLEYASDCELALHGSALPGAGVQGRCCGDARCLPAPRQSGGRWPCGAVHPVRRAPRKTKGCRLEFAQDVLPLLGSHITLEDVDRPGDNGVGYCCEHSPRLSTEGQSPASKNCGGVRDARALAVVVPNIPTGHDSEGFGLTALGGAADGGVLIASGIEGIVDAVVDGETSFLLPALEMLLHRASKIREISNGHPTERVLFVQHAKEIVRARYSWSHVSCQLLEQYQEAVGKSWGPRAMRKGR